MKRITDICCYNIVFLLIVGVPGYAFAQEVSFSATASQNKIGLKDAVQVTYTISNLGNIRDIGATSIGDFELLQPPFENIINNNGHVSISRSYLLHPKHVGTLTLPPGLARDAAGHTYRSNPVTIQVVPGSLAPAQKARPQKRRDPFGGDEDEDDPFAIMNHLDRQMQAMMQSAGMGRMQSPLERPRRQQHVTQEQAQKNVMLKVFVDKTKVRVGEQVIATYKLCSPYETEFSQFTRMPSFVGFWTQELMPSRERQQSVEVIDGKKYMTIPVLKMAVFPQETGNLELDPIEGEGVVSSDEGPIGVRMSSAPVKISVTALPDKNKTAGFGGAVGSFAITAKLDKQEMTTDNIATLKIEISGTGNLKLIETPRPSLPQGITTYDPQIADTITSRNTDITGNKYITYAITAHAPGDYTIPSIPFSYFDPKTNGYVTLHTDSFKLHVKPGKNITSGENAATQKDISDISTVPAQKLSDNKQPLMLTVGYWSAYALPLLAFVGILFWRRKNALPANPVGGSETEKSVKTAGTATQRLAAAKTLLSQPNQKPFYDEVSKGVWLYLSDKLGIPLFALSKEAAANAMIDKKVPSSLISDFATVMSDCESALYASGGFKSAEQTYNEAVKLITDLDNVL